MRPDHTSTRDIHQDNSETRNRLVLIFLLASIVLSVTVGRYAVHFTDIPRLFHEQMTHAVPDADRKAVNILFLVRIPRILLTVLIGAALFLYLLFRGRKELG